jgi:putative oxidoreductase
MKIAVIIVRTLIGILFLVSVIGYFFKLMPQPELGEGARLFVVGLDASVYLMPVVKVIELLCAIAFISGRFVPLATVVIFPITLNIILFHGFLAPDEMAIPAFLFLGNLFLAFYHRKNYQSLVVAN